MNIAEILEDLSKSLKAVNTERSLLEARLIVSSVLDLPIEQLIIQDRRDLTYSEVARMKTLAQRRLNYEPMAYILGKKEFYGLTFKVNPSVLIPRPETESLVTHILDWIKAKNILNPSIIDLGTGSGCIAASLKKNIFGRSEVWALDISTQALDVARSNAKRLKAEIKFIEGDILSAQTDQILPSSFDIIVSNPPYVPDVDYETLQPDILNYEPKNALVAGPLGLYFYEAIFAKWLQRLKRPGLLALETMGPQQQEKLKTKVSVVDASKTWHDGPHIFYEYG